VALPARLLLARRESRATAALDVFGIEAHYPALFYGVNAFLDFSLKPNQLFHTSPLALEHGKNSGLSRAMKPLLDLPRSKSARGRQGA
jgi:hypothetical protein